MFGSQTTTNPYIDLRHLIVSAAVPKSHSRRGGTGAILAQIQLRASR